MHTILGLGAMTDIKIQKVIVLALKGPYIQSEIIKLHKWPQIHKGVSKDGFESENLAWKSPGSGF